LNAPVVPSASVRRKRFAGHRAALWGLLLCLGGCAQPVPSLYQWGSYEDQVYAMSVEPDKTSVEEQVIKLEADRQKARATDKAVPPGFHAHLGYLYVRLGRLDAARGEFQTEAALFPESKLYMDRLISRVDGSGRKSSPVGGGSGSIDNNKQQGRRP
jgi:hypothetical protein